MPHVADERKLVAWQMIEDGSSIADICRQTGPQGLFPRTRKEMSGGTVSNLKKRARKHGDALYRKKRCDAGTLTALQGDALELALEHTSTTSTAELLGLLLLLQS
jgi:hypothetical protein